MLDKRELKYIIYGDDQLSDEFRRITKASEASGQKLNRHTRHVMGAKQAYKDLSAEIPLLGTATRLVSNPIVLGTAAIAGIGAALNSATHAAADFNSGFRELNNMNLDKSRDEIRKLKKEILGTAFDEGFDANQTTTGFYDIQSITGKYGREVDMIVSKQGEFAQVMKANFNEWIAGTGKAMANYGFGADELDRYNKSAAATVQVGVTTYDQYAKVSSVFAGSAAAANQSYDSANKLFALYTKKTKTVDEAATLVKSAFIDLFKDSSIKAFKEVGIDLFNTKGEAKQVDQIMKELNAKFATSKNDKAMNALRNQFTGSEGLIALVQTASDQSGDMLRSFDAFDNTSFDFNKALKEARKDMNYMDEQVSNKLKASWIALGDAVLPTWVKIKEIIVEILDGTKRVVMNAQHLLGYGESANGKDYREVREKYLEETVAEGKKKLAAMSGLTGAQQQAQLDAWGMTRRWADDQQSALFKGTDYKKASDLPKDLRLEYEQYSGYKQAYDKLIDMYWNPDKYKEQTQTTTNATELGTPTSNSTAISKGLETVAGGGSRVRNITVSIDKLIEQLNLHSENVKEGAAEIKEIVQEEMMRAVAGFEQSI